MIKKNRRAIGEQYERMAQDFLIKQGLVLRDANFCAQGGEIDLIMNDGDTLVFIEVRARKNTDFGGALESIDAKKQARIARVALAYLTKHKLDMPCRFDAVGIQNKEVLWIKNAFLAH